MSSRNKNLFRLILSAMFLAMALFLPFLTGQNQQFGKMLCLMHIPVLLCGFVCGPWYGLCVGLAAPLMRSLIFGMPPMMPTAVAMAFELLTYGCAAGLLYRAFPKKIWRVYPALVLSMLAGRFVWGIAMTALTGLGLNKGGFGWAIFWTNGFATALPGIALQIVLIPAVVMALEKAFPAFMKQK
ncbi:MAG: ECF transporter S component [Clostridia bacterium]|nr:ECF transporter S component [Clostridia bacterium]